MTISAGDVRRVDEVCLLGIDLVGLPLQYQNYLLLYIHLDMITVQ